MATLNEKQKVGRSQHTQLKQRDLEYFLSVHLKILKTISQKKTWIDNKIFYADIFAGDGGLNNCDGSPVVFERVKDKLELNCDPVFIEENPVTANRLAKKIKTPVTNARNEHVVPQFQPQKNQFGLMYVDPNGDPPFNLINDFYKKKNTDRIDLLIYFSGTTIKRSLHSPITNRNITLKDNILSLPKKHWLIRNITGKFQWSFLVGTNWIDIPTFKQIGFHRIDSMVGQSILNTVTHTAKELKHISRILPSIQLNLFGEEYD